MKMSGVIYADVLIVINLYVTYFLLLSVSLLCRESAERMRLLLSSLFGAFYSLTVLLPEKFYYVTVFLRVVAFCFPVFIAFGFRNLKRFLRLNVCYLLCNFFFAGLMFALWYFVCPAGMYYNGSVVYFDIDILTLVIFTVVCYGFVKLFDLLFKTRAPINTVFYCKVRINGEDICLKAFLDTGNNLSDPFSGKPVIISHKEKFNGKDPPSEKQRFVLCSTVSGKSLLPAFSPDEIFIKGAEVEFITDRAMIALTEEKLMGGEYDAILPMGLFDKINERKDERESEENSFTVKKSKGEAEGKAFSFAGVLRKRAGKSSAASYKGEGK